MAITLWGYSHSSYALLPLILLQNSFKSLDGLRTCCSSSELILEVYFFQASLFFSIENAKFWPSILVNFGYFVANLRTFGCTEIDIYIRYAPPLHIITTLQFSKLITFPSGPWQLCQLQRLRANGNNPKNRPDLDWSGYWIRCLHRSNYSTIQPLTVIGQNFYPILTST